MNEHIPEVKIHGVHSLRGTVQKRKTKLINVEFTFWLIAGILKKVEIELLDFQHKLHPYGFYSKALRESFVLPLTELRAKLKPLGKQALKDSLDEALESIVKEHLYDPMWLYQFLSEKIKRLKDGRK